MLRITTGLELDESELSFDFVRAGGPGGQNVNKLATAAQLRFDVRNSPSLPAAIKARLTALAGSRMTDAGMLVIDARRHRTQAANRQDAIDRLVALIRQAAVVPRRRHKTRPTAGSQRRRIESKKRRGQVKSLRRGGADQG